MLIESDQDLSNVFGEEGLIKQFSKHISECALEAEIQSHLFVMRSDLNNARNGIFYKDI